MSPHGLLKGNVISIGCQSHQTKLLNWLPLLLLNSLNLAQAPKLINHQGRKVKKSCSWDEKIKACGCIWRISLHSSLKISKMQHDNGNRSTIGSMSCNVSYNLIRQGRNSSKDRLKMQINKNINLNVHSEKQSIEISLLYLYSGRSFHETKLVGISTETMKGTSLTR